MCDRNDKKNVKINISNCVNVDNFLIRRFHTSYTCIERVLAPLKKIAKNISQSNVKTERYTENLRTDFYVCNIPLKVQPQATTSSYKIYYTHKKYEKHDFITSSPSFKLN